LKWLALVDFYDQKTEQQQRPENSGHEKITTVLVKEHSTAVPSDQQLSDSTVPSDQQLHSTVPSDQQLHSTVPSDQQLSDNSAVVVSQSTTAQSVVEKTTSTIHLNMHQSGAVMEKSARSNRKVYPEQLDEVPNCQTPVEPLMPPPQGSPEHQGSKPPVKKFNSFGALNMEPSFDESTDSFEQAAEITETSGDSGDESSRSQKSKWKTAKTGLAAASTMETLGEETRALYGSHSGEEDQYKPSWYIIPVDSPFKTKWDISQLIVLAYVALVVPVRVCFSVETYGAEFVIECLVDIYFYVDIIINFISAVKIEQGIEIIIVHKMKEIAMLYFKGWFCLDVLACLPIDYVTRLNDGTLGCSFTNCDAELANIQGEEGGSPLKLLKIMRTFRLMKLVRLTRVKRILKRYEDQLVYWQQILVFVKVILVVFISSHWLGCLYGSVYDWDNYNRKAEDPWEEPDIYDKWVACFYWAVQTTTTVGYGDLTSSSIQGQLVSAFAMTIGGVVFSWFMSTIMTLLNPDPAAVQHQETMQYVVGYLRANGLPVQMAARVLAYFRKNNDFEFDENKMLHSLPVPIRQEICDFMYTDSIRQAPILKQQDERFISELCLAVRPMTYDEYDIIYQVGDQTEEIYILVTGKVSIMHLNPKDVLHSTVVDTQNIDAKVVTTFEEPGAYFGEESLFGCQLHIENVVARHPVKLLSISKDILMPLLDSHPEVRADMMRLFLGKIHMFASPETQKETLKTIGCYKLFDRSAGVMKKDWRSTLDSDQKVQAEIKARESTIANLGPLPGMGGSSSSPTPNSTGVARTTSNNHHQRSSAPAGGGFGGGGGGGVDAVQLAALMTSVANFQAEMKSELASIRSFVTQEVEDIKKVLLSPPLMLGTKPMQIEHLHLDPLELQVEKLASSIGLDQN